MYPSWKHLKLLKFSEKLLEIRFWLMQLTATGNMVLDQKEKMAD